MTQNADEKFHLDLVDCDDISENAVLTEIEKRYYKDVIYSSIGPILIALNPYKIIEPLYSKDILNHFVKLSIVDSIEKTSGMKDIYKFPHVWEIAMNSYLDIRLNRRSQAIVISGESGAGKTETTKKCLQLLSCVASISTPHIENSTNNIEDRILATNPVLESFGNSKTARNNNSSRFGKWIQINYRVKRFNKALSESDSLPTPFLVGANITSYLLEKSRVIAHSMEERNYHIFYQLCANGVQGLKEASHYKFLKATGSGTLSKTVLKVPGIDDANDFKDTIKSMTSLGFSKETQDTIFGALKAILLMGNIEFKEQSNSHSKNINILSPESKNLITTISEILGFSINDFTHAITTRSMTVRGETTIIHFTPPQAYDAIYAFVKEIYGRIFNYIVYQANISLGDSSPSNNINELYSNTDKISIGLLDIFGFEKFKFNTFEQLCINYANEKLHNHFLNFVIMKEEELYKMEDINFQFQLPSDNEDVIRLFEDKIDGLFSRLDDEIKFPMGSDEAFIKKLEKIYQNSQYKGSDKNEKTNKVFIKDVKMTTTQFEIKHFAGVIRYDCMGFLEKNKDKLFDHLDELLANSKNKIFQEMMILHLNNNLEDSNNNEVISTGPNNLSLSSTISTRFQFQLNCLIQTLNSSNPHFIKCIKPNNNKDPLFFDGTLVGLQLQYSGIIELLSLRRSGFPLRKSHEEFWKNYWMLGKGVNRSYLKSLIITDKTKENTNEIVFEDNNKGRCEYILKFLTQQYGDIRLGKTLVFLRQNSLSLLEKEKLRRRRLIYFKILSFYFCRKEIFNLKLLKNSHKRLKNTCNKILDLLFDINYNENYTNDLSNLNSFFQFNLNKIIELKEELLSDLDEVKTIQIPDYILNTCQIIVTLLDKLITLFSKIYSIIFDKKNYSANDKKSFLETNNLSIKEILKILNDSLQQLHNCTLYIISTNDIIITLIPKKFNELIDAFEFTSTDLLPKFEYNSPLMNCYYIVSLHHNVLTVANNATLELKEAVAQGDDDSFHNIYSNVLKLREIFGTFNEPEFQKAVNMSKNIENEYNFLEEYISLIQSYYSSLLEVNLEENNSLPLKSIEFKGNYTFNQRKESYNYSSIKDKINSFHNNLKSLTIKFFKSSSFSTIPNISSKRIQNILMSIDKMYSLHTQFINSNWNECCKSGNDLNTLILDFQSIVSNFVCDYTEIPAQSKNNLLLQTAWNIIYEIFILEVSFFQHDVILNSLANLWKDKLVKSRSLLYITDDNDEPQAVTSLISLIDEIKLSPWFTNLLDSSKNLIELIEALIQLRYCYTDKRYDQLLEELESPSQFENRIVLIETWIHSIIRNNDNLYDETFISESEKFIGASKVEAQNKNILDNVSFIEELIYMIKEIENEKDVLYFQILNLFVGKRLSKVILVESPIILKSDLSDPLERTIQIFNDTKTFSEELLKPFSNLKSSNDNQSIDYFCFQLQKCLNSLLKLIDLTHLKKGQEHLIFKMWEEGEFDIDVSILQAKSEDELDDDSTINQDNILFNKSLRSGHESINRIVLDACQQYIHNKMVELIFSNPFNFIEYTQKCKLSNPEVKTEDSSFEFGDKLHHFLNYPDVSKTLIDLSVVVSALLSAKKIYSQTIYGVIEHEKSINDLHKVYSEHKESLTKEQDEIISIQLIEFEKKFNFVRLSSEMFKMIHLNQPVKYILSKSEMHSISKSINSSDDSDVDELDDLYEIQPVQRTRARTSSLSVGNNSSPITTRHKSLSFDVGSQGSMQSSHSIQYITHQGLADVLKEDSVSINNSSLGIVLLELLLEKVDNFIISLNIPYSKNNIENEVSCDVISEFFPSDFINTLRILREIFSIRENISQYLWRNAFKTFVNLQSSLNLNLFPDIECTYLIPFTENAEFQPINEELKINSNDIHVYATIDCCLIALSKTHEPPTTTSSRNNSNTFTDQSGQITPIKDSNTNQDTFSPDPSFALLDEAIHLCQTIKEPSPRIVHLNLALNRIKELRQAQKANNWPEIRNCVNKLNTDKIGTGYSIICKNEVHRAKIECEHYEGIQLLKSAIMNEEMSIKNSFLDIENISTKELQSAISTVSILPEETKSHSAVFKILLSLAETILKARKYATQLDKGVIQNVVGLLKDSIEMFQDELDGKEKISRKSLSTSRSSTFFRGTIFASSKEKSKSTLVVNQIVDPQGANIIGAAPRAQIWEEFSDLMTSMKREVKAIEHHVAVSDLEKTLLNALVTGGITKHENGEVNKEDIKIDELTSAVEIATSLENSTYSIPPNLQELLKAASIILEIRTAILEDTWESKSSIFEGIIGDKLTIFPESCRSEIEIVRKKLEDRWVIQNLITNMQVGQLKGDLTDDSLSQVDNLHVKRIIENTKLMGSYSDAAAFLLKSAERICELRELLMKKYQLSVVGGQALNSLESQAISWNSIKKMANEILNEATNLKTLHTAIVPEVKLIIELSDDRTLTESLTQSLTSGRPIGEPGEIKISSASISELDRAYQQAIKSKITTERAKILISIVKLVKLMRESLLRSESTSNRESLIELWKVINSTLNKITDLLKDGADSSNMTYYYNNDTTVSIKRDIWKLCEDEIDLVTKHSKVKKLQNSLIDTAIQASQIYSLNNQISLIDESDHINLLNENFKKITDYLDVIIAEAQSAKLEDSQLMQKYLAVATTLRLYRTAIFEKNWIKLGELIRDINLRNSMKIIPEVEKELAWVLCEYHNNTVIKILMNAAIPKQFKKAKSNSDLLYKSKYYTEENDYEIIENYEDSSVWDLNTIQSQDFIERNNILNKALIEIVQYTITSSRALEWKSIVSQMHELRKSLEVHDNEKVASIFKWFKINSRICPYYIKSETQKAYVMHQNELLFNGLNEAISIGKPIGKCGEIDRASIKVDHLRSLINQSNYIDLLLPEVNELLSAAKVVLEVREALINRDNITRLQSVVQDLSYQDKFPLNIVDEIAIARTELDDEIVIQSLSDALKSFDSNEVKCFDLAFINSKEVVETSEKEESDQQINTEVTTTKKHNVSILHSISERRYSFSNATHYDIDSIDLEVLDAAIRVSDDHGIYSERALRLLNSVKLIRSLRYFMKNSNWIQLEKCLIDSKFNENIGVKYDQLASLEIQSMLSQIQVRSSIIDLSKALKIGWASCSHGIVDTSKMNNELLSDAIERADHCIKELSLRSNGMIDFDSDAESVSSYIEDQDDSTVSSIKSKGSKRRVKFDDVDSINSKKKNKPKKKKKTHASNSFESSIQQQVKLLMDSSKIVLKIREILAIGNIELAGALAEEYLLHHSLHSNVLDELRLYEKEINASITTMNMLENLKKSLQEGTINDIQNNFKIVLIDLEIHMGNDLGTISMLMTYQKQYEDLIKLRSKMRHMIQTEFDLPLLKSVLEQAEKVSYRDEELQELKSKIERITSFEYCARYLFQLWIFNENCFPLHTVMQNILFISKRLGMGEHQLARRAKMMSQIQSSNFNPLKVILSFSNPSYFFSIQTITMLSKRNYLMLQSSQSKYKIENFPNLRKPEEYAIRMTVLSKELKESMLVYSDAPLPASLTLLSPAFSTIAIFVFTNYINGLTKGLFSKSLYLSMLSKLIKLGQKCVSLRDEIFLQIIKQIRGNPDEASVTKLWILMNACLSFFSPSMILENYLEMFFNNNLFENSITTTTVMPQSTIVSKPTEFTNVNVVPSRYRTYVERSIRLLHKSVFLYGYLHTIDMKWTQEDIDRKLGPFFIDDDNKSISKNLLLPKLMDPPTPIITNNSIDETIPKKQTLILLESDDININYSFPIIDLTNDPAFNDIVSPTLSYQPQQLPNQVIAQQLKNIPSTSTKFVSSKQIPLEESIVDHSVKYPIIRDISTLAKIRGIRENWMYRFLLFSGHPLENFGSESFSLSTNQYINKFKFVNSITNCFNISYKIDKFDRDILLYLIFGNKIQYKHLFRGNEPLLTLHADEEIFHFKSDDEAQSSKLRRKWLLENIGNAIQLKTKGNETSSSSSISNQKSTSSVVSSSTPSTNSSPPSSPKSEFRKQLKLLNNDDDEESDYESDQESYTSSDSFSTRASVLTDIDALNFNSTMNSHTQCISNGTSQIFMQLHDSDVIQFTEKFWDKVIVKMSRECVHFPFLNIDAYQFNRKNQISSNNFNLNTSDSLTLSDSKFEGEDIHITWELFRELVLVGVQKLIEEKHTLKNVKSN